MSVEALQAATPGHALLSSYARSRSEHDELVDEHGHVRPHWLKLLDELAALSPDERQSRADALNRRVRETGIAYDIFADPRSPQRWTVDLVPLILDPVDWAWLERALIQRARLFDALLRDLYGAQRVLREGVVPPALVLSDTTFLRPAHGIAPRDGPLVFYAADLARNPDGTWRVIDNHTETPAGAGFALANRVVHTHVAGDMFQAAGARRIAGFFQQVQSTLLALSGRANPRIALLTPGPHHPDYFGHAYLARDLGYLLVEGGDLTVQGDRVCLKTLEGLKTIDTLVRCIDGAAADALELDPRRHDGPIGLVGACRRLPSFAANALGSAVAQNRGLGSYLPAISERLLAEPLLLHDAKRWWLGSADAVRHVMAKPDGLVIRKTQEGTGRPGGAAPPNDAQTLAEKDRALLRETLRADGTGLVAEERASYGTVPGFRGGKIEPRPFALRLFVARTSSGFAVMPGGLAMTVDPTRAVAMTAPEGETRDVWIAADGTSPPHVSLWRPAIETARVERSQRVTQSRVADNLFWLGRYAERADWKLRVLRSAVLRLREDSGPADVHHAARICLEQILSEPASPRTADTNNAVAVHRLAAAIVSAKPGHYNLGRTLDSLHRVASLTRDRLSLEAWRTLGIFQAGDAWRTAISEFAPQQALDLLEEGLQRLAALNGLMHENMTRNFGWSFTDIGRRIERAHNLAEAVSALFVATPPADQEPMSLYFLLELADSFITYRSRYRLDPMLALVLDLLLVDETNPRSLAFQLAAITRHLEALPQAKNGTALPEDRRIALSLLTSIRLANVEQLAGSPGREGLGSLLAEHVSLLPKLSNAIGRRYFNLSEDRPQRVQPRFEPRP